MRISNDFSIDTKHTQSQTNTKECQETNERIKCTGLEGTTRLHGEFNAEESWEGKRVGNCRLWGPGTDENSRELKREER